MFSHTVTNRIVSQLLVVILIVAFISIGPWTNTAKAETVTYSTPMNNQQYLAFLYGQLLQLQVQLAILIKLQAEQTALSPVEKRRYANPFYMQVTTDAASAVGRTTAELQAEANKGSSGTALVWFEYGVGNSLNKDSDKVEVNYNYTRQTAYKIRISDLKPDTRYSYRAVIEDEDGNIVLGQIRTLTTVKPAATLSFIGQPVVESEGVEKVTRSSADVKVFVSMNDYDNGTVFYVYSKDRSSLTDLEDDYDNYDDIPTARGANLIKQKTRGEVNERTTVTGKISRLTQATKFYYRACVEYEYRSDLVFRCSDIESFVTAN
ncbi:MAG: hypothetical protein H6779_04490 [Candidatus Nomurabacteria bacterium]|nr:hypothetical protein [Candidatus Nomurabacteria bacterium]USN87635.1 MAG: hypothetical protein H6779_04490 [Candidatus Nomurabacteria bacterium]